MIKKFNHKNNILYKKSPVENKEEKKKINQIIFHPLSYKLAKTIKWMNKIGQIKTLKNGKIIQLKKIKVKNNNLKDKIKRNGKRKIFLINKKNKTYLNKVKIEVKNSIIM